MTQRAARTPSWRDRAECAIRAVPPEAFFPQAGPIPSEALLACFACPVRAECLADQMAWEARHYQSMRRTGIFGGLTPKQRARLAKGLTVRMLPPSDRNRQRKRDRAAS